MIGKEQSTGAGSEDPAEAFDDDIPDLSTPEWRAKFDAAPVIRRGRPPLPAAKVSTTIRLDADVLEKFRATGPGWQSRINAILKAAKP
ncbi:BrnA antitoxin family protein [Amaricoccus sp.]|uniref:BrnA antitoxin family protein n=1 Tax=Amaricoccus sp. TaxID=1872485 RepID=UPI001B6F96E1|nr:BrnA antitoxin family protein [Amaricoccus sp.]MBP7002094.1 BrnA antitoxin family protein [Amaricoccus sp.]